MSEEQVLTKEVAEQFLADEDSVNLSEFTALEDAAAEVLSRHSGMLVLDGLQSLSDAAAVSLSKHTEDIDLGGLTSITDASAKSLSTKGGSLSLDGLTHLSAAAAESLSELNGTLRLPLFSNLSCWDDVICRLIAKKKDALTASTYTNSWGCMETASPLWGFVSDLKVRVGCGNCGCSQYICVDPDLGEYPGDVEPSLEQQEWKSFQSDNWSSDPVIRCPGCV